MTRVHQAARSLDGDGYHVLVIGQRGHVEVEGITEDLDHCDVIESADEVTAVSFNRLGIVCQTTATERRVASIRQAIAVQNPDAEIKFIDTVCSADQGTPACSREAAASGLTRSWSSADGTRTIRESWSARCRESGKPAVHVQSAADLDPGWFRDFATVGLTAGTSTLAETIDEVHRALVWIGGQGEFRSDDREGSHRQVNVAASGLHPAVAWPWDRTAACRGRETRRGRRSLAA